jgi:hypothetical protein
VTGSQRQLSTTRNTWPPAIFEDQSRDNRRDHVVAEDLAQRPKTLLLVTIKLARSKREDTS